MRYNIDYVCQHIVTNIPTPIRDFTSAPRMIIIRSFDINRPGNIKNKIYHSRYKTWKPFMLGTEIKDLKGGVAGGSILKGVLKVGDEIEVRPALITNENGVLK